MSTKGRERPESDSGTEQLLRRLTIVQLGLAGIPQKNIRRIVGGAIGKINGIVKLLHPKAHGGINAPKN